MLGDLGPVAQDGEGEEEGKHVVLRAEPPRLRARHDEGDGGPEGGFGRPGRRTRPEFEECGGEVLVGEEAGRGQAERVPYGPLGEAVQAELAEAQDVGVFAPVAQVSVVDGVRPAVVGQDAEDEEGVEELQALVLGAGGEEVVVRGFVHEILKGPQPACDDEGGEEVDDAGAGSGEGGREGCDLGQCDAGGYYKVVGQDGEHGFRAVSSLECPGDGGGLLHGSILRVRRSLRHHNGRRGRLGSRDVDCGGRHDVHICVDCEARSCGDSRMLSGTGGLMPTELDS